MHTVLEKILQTNLVDDGAAQLRLHSNMSREKGVLIDKVFKAVRPDILVEIGFAYGISTLFVCDALSANSKPATHIVIDPAQHSHWAGIGLKNIVRAGYKHFIDFREERSELALPSLVASGTQIQAAIIDGHHTFDHVMVDFFYINKMLTVGGIVILDDTNFPSISRVVEHILTYPAYEIFATTAQPPTSMRTKVRRALARRIPKLRREWDYRGGGGRFNDVPSWATPSSAARAWDYHSLKAFWAYPSCMAFRKVAEDDRRWDWHVDF